jgi:hypothetical protein
MYIYQADVYCDSCGDKIQQALDQAKQSPEDWDDESSYDSDDFPKGPYDEHYQETDTPQHCGDCGIFLENPLTQDGYDYVINQAITHPDSETVNEWLRFYNLEYDSEPYFDRFDICEAYYLFASQYHSRQWSAEYQIFGILDRIGFRLGARGLDYTSLSENARGIYIRLARKANARIRKAA